MTLTKERLHSLFSFDAETGIFIRKKTTNHLAKEGTRAEAKNVRGYIVICIDQKSYLAHRLAWFYVYEKWPDKNIDHIDGIRTNNAIKNLRDVSQGINTRNLKRCHNDNNTGFLGVYKNRNKYSARIMVDGKVTCLGTYETPEEANKAYLVKKALNEMKELK